MIASSSGWVTLGDANAAAQAWCEQVNAAGHSEIAAVSVQRLAAEVAALRPLPALRAAVDPWCRA